MLTSDPDHLRARLAASLPPGVVVLIERLSAVADQHGTAIYLVGGLVRDLLLDRANLDLDIVVQADAPAFAQAVVDRFGGALLTHAAFRTAVWTPGAFGESLGIADILDHVDLATARSETYPYAAALPVIAPGTLAQDLARRDFTINTLAIRLPDFTLIDHHSGLTDLANRTIRVLHPASFRDDPTRLFRAVRYQARYAFTIEPETFSWIADGVAYVAALTGERITHEIDKIFSEPNADHMLFRLCEYGIWDAIAPDLMPDWIAINDALGNLSAFSAKTPLPDPMLCRWYSLLALCMQPETVIRRLNLLSALKPIAQIGIARDHVDRLDPVKTAPSAWAHVLDMLDENQLIALYAITPDRQRRSAIETQFADWRHRKPTLTGADLRALGLPPGPAFGKILAALRDQRLDGSIQTPEQERAFVTTWLTDSAKNGLS